MLDPNYEAFVQIVEAGSISAAARERGLSTAAMSKRLTQLEERLGICLVHRSTRRLAPTQAGKDLLAALLPLRTEVKAVEERLNGEHVRIAGALRVTAPTSFGRMHIMPCLPSFLAHYPEIALTIDLSDGFADLHDGSYALAIRIGAKAGAGLISHPLDSSSRVLCAAPSYLEAFGEPRTLADLAGHRLLATDAQLPWQLEGPEGAIVRHGVSHVRTNSSEAVRELALGGCGIALRSLWDVSRELKAGTLRRVLPDYQGSQDVGVFAVYAASPTIPPRVQALVEHLSRHFAQAR